MSFLESGAVRVKVCGITNEMDAKMCISAGADALGFNFYSKSQRYLDPDRALDWIQKLDGRIDRVAVVVNPDECLLDKLRNAECFEMIQFHGDENPAFCEAARFANWIKAIRVRDENSIHEAFAYHTPNLLFDSWVSGEYGGTGRHFDWEIARDLAASNDDRRLILAGGLTVRNVREAVNIVHPFAVDVAGGVEESPGKKEARLVRDFIQAVHGEK